MAIKIFFIVFLFSFAGCVTKHSDMEICFENIRNRIKSDSILKKITYSSIDSYRDFASVINKAVTEESKSKSTCTTALNKFLKDNNENSITVNNLIFFQQFQAYLKHEKFNKSEAKDIALRYEEKWK